MGISFCSDTLVRHVPDDEGLVYYKLDHKDALREVNFYYKRGRYMPRVVSTFLEMI
jgi:DNA-binding transcriptional LysR family regulator